MYVNEVEFKSCWIHLVDHREQGYSLVNTVLWNFLNKEWKPRTSKSSN